MARLKVGERADQFTEAYRVDEGVIQQLTRYHNSVSLPHRPSALGSKGLAAANLLMVGALRL